MLLLAVFLAYTAYTRQAVSVSPSQDVGEAPPARRRL